MPDTPGYEDVLLTEIDRQAERRARAMAAQMGPPPGTRKLSDDREVQEWLRGDDSIDVDALMAQGIPIEEITRAKYPNRVRLIESHSPEWEKRVEYAEKMAKRAEEAKAKLTPLTYGAPQAPPMVAPEPAPASAMPMPPSLVVPPMNGAGMMPPAPMNGSAQPEQGGY